MLLGVLAVFYSLEVPNFDPRVVIDTGRNGVMNNREDCSSWCNIRGAGVGLLPTTLTAAPEIVDAYFWVKSKFPCPSCPFMCSIRSSIQLCLFLLWSRLWFLCSNAVPGESDGCTALLPSSDGSESCPRFDDGCASEDSIGSRQGEPRAPEAGQWFDFAAKSLAANAAWADS